MKAILQKSSTSFLALVLVCWLVFGNSLSNEFALDDLSAITGNSLVQKGVSGISEIWSHAYLYGYNGTDDESYRPLPLSIHAILYSISGPDSPFIHHFFQVLLYSLFCGIALLLVRNWFPKHPQFSWLVLLLFAVHPVHTEVVANVKSLDELLAFGLGISSLYLFNRYWENQGKVWLAASLGVFFLALCSKENALTLLPLFPLSVWFFRSANARKAGLQSALLLLPVVLYFAIRTSVLSSQTFIDENEKLSAINNALLLANSGGEYVATAFSILLHYLNLLVFPQPLTYDYSLGFFELIGLSSPSFWMALLLYLGIAAGAVWGWRQKQAYGFGLIWFLVTLSIYSNLFVSIASSAGERFLLLPSFGFILAVASWIYFQVLKESKNSATIAFTAVLAVFYGVLSMQRNPVWKNNDTLLLTDVKTSSNSFRANWFAGEQMKRRALSSSNLSQRNEDLNEAFQYLTKSYSIYSDYTDIYYEMADVLKNQGEWNKMKKVGLEGHKKFPEDEQISLQLGEACLNLQQFPEARKYFSSLYLSQDTGHQYLGWFNTGATYLNEGVFDSSQVYFSQARQLRPESEDVNYYLAMSEFQIGNQEAAIQAFQKVGPSHPGFAHAQSSIGTILLIQGQFEDALLPLKTALSYVPGDDNILTNLAAAYHELGNEEKAQECLGMIGNGAVIGE